MAPLRTSHAVCVRAGVRWPFPYSPAREHQRRLRPASEAMDPGHRTDGRRSPRTQALARPDQASAGSTCPSPCSRSRGAGVAAMRPRTKIRSRCAALPRAGPGTRRTRYTPCPSHQRRAPRRAASPAGRLPSGCARPRAVGGGTDGLASWVSQPLRIGPRTPRLRMPAHAPRTSSAYSSRKGPVSAQ